MQSASQSRLASIYSGQTGFDIYTRATSDVYQDLKGEGIFTGKGIYEVETLSRVLEHRFPRNALLSHDLIEGAYARAGLVSDVEVIDDYPSHYSAYNRRKHRWVRGDWQIVSWLFGRVPDETGRRVPNPISFLSRWKILDNLRRSLVEAGIFLLFVLGWTVLPGRPLYWTLVTIAILFVPPWFQFAFSVVRTLASGQMRPFGDAAHRIGQGHGQRFSHADVPGPSDADLGRRGVAHLLSPTGLAATPAGVGDGSGSGNGDRQAYLRRCSAELDAGGGADCRCDRLRCRIGTRCTKLCRSCFCGRSASRSAVAESAAAAGSEECHCAGPALSPPGRAVHLALLRDVQQCGAQLADSGQRAGRADASCGARLSPTNLGFLFNARQVAVEFGYLTTPEFVQQNIRTLETVARLPKDHGHLYNWYDTRTLEADRPRFVSTVDSGNLAASSHHFEGWLPRSAEAPAAEFRATGRLRRLSVRVGRSGTVVSRKLARSFEKPSDDHWLDRLLSSVEIPEVE